MGFVLMQRGKRPLLWELWDRKSIFLAQRTCKMHICLCCCWTISVSLLGGSPADDAFSMLNGGAYLFSMYVLLRPVDSRRMHFR
jgi:hypothetical protein